jgi:hypothetical protein
MEAMEGYAMAVTGIAVLLGASLYLVGKVAFNRGREAGRQELSQAEANWRTRVMLQLGISGTPNCTRKAIRSALELQKPAHLPWASYAAAVREICEQAVYEERERDNLIAGLPGHNDPHGGMG